MYSPHNPFKNETFLKNIDISSIQTVLELGAFDGLFTKEINEIYSPAKIYSVEANPDQIETIIENQKKLNNVNFSSVLLSDSTEEIDFYIFKDSGASSSIYEHPDGYIKKIKLRATTLDQFCINHNISSIDLICADVEGAEAKIFKNQNILYNVKYIISEVKMDKNFKGNKFPGINELKESLTPYGFEMVEYVCFPGFPFGDSLWIKK